MDALNGTVSPSLSLSDLPGAKKIQPGGAGTRRVLPLYPGTVSPCHTSY